MIFERQIATLNRLSPEEAFELCDGNVAFDVDGVLLNYVGGFTERVFRKHGVRAAIKDPVTYGFTCLYPDWDQARIYREIFDFNHTRGSGFEALEPLPGVVDAIERIRAAGGRVRLITKSSRHGVPALSRLDNLDAVFGRNVFEDVVQLDFEDSKADALEAIPMSMWLDDVPRHVLEGFEAGHPSWLCAMGHNAGEVGLRSRRVSGVAELFDFLEK